MSVSKTTSRKPGGNRKKRETHLHHGNILSNALPRSVPKGYPVALHLFRSDTARPFDPSARVEYRCVRSEALRVQMDWQGRHSHNGLRRDLLESGGVRCCEFAKPISTYLGREKGACHDSSTLRDVAWKVDCCRWC